MILFDHPRPTTFRRFKVTAHMMSDQLAEAGTAELDAFARRIGLKTQWRQKSGTETEHYDLFDGAIERARAAGATEVRGIELIERCVRPKRAARPSLRAGDVVRHRPSGETWVVAAIGGDEVSPAGWPPSLARTSDCELVERCSDEEHVRMARHDWSVQDDRRRLAHGHDCDACRRIARVEP